MGVRVLVVDVEPAVRMLISYALGDAGVEVEQAGTGREAVALLKQKRFDALFADRGLPDCSAEELAGCARKVQHDLPVILTTAEPAHRAVLSESLDACVNKPFKLSALNAALDKAIASRRPAAKAG